MSNVIINTKVEDDVYPSCVLHMAEVQKSLHHKARPQKGSCGVTKLLTGFTARQEADALQRVAGTPGKKG